MIRLEATAAEIEALLQLALLEASATSSPGTDLEERRQAARALLSGPLQERFQSLQAHARGPALPLARASHCPACHVRFASHLESKLRGRTLLLACPHCRRLLFQVAAPPERA